METLEFRPQEAMSDEERQLRAMMNPIISTDTYNRTMDHLRGPEGWREEETYVLQMRKSPYGYHVAAGIEDAVREVTGKQITQEMLDEADDYFTNENNVAFFNRAMWQEIIDEHDGYLPIEINGVRDGTVMLPGEPLMRITGPGELIAHFEHVFHRPYYQTLVATKAHEITKLLGDPSRFIEVGKRGTPNELTHMQAIKAMQIGGDITMSSNDAAAYAYDNVQSAGTIGHRYVQRFPSVEEAFAHAAKNLDRVSLLVDLINSYDGMNAALELKQAYRNTSKQIWARLDSGDLKAQVRYYMDRCAELAFFDPVKDRLIVEGFEDINEIAEIESILSETEKKRVSYGGGGILVADQTARSDASSGFKLAEYVTSYGERIETRKFSMGKASLPGQPTLVINGLRRTIAQVKEMKGDDLLEVLYRPGSPIIMSSIDQARARRTETYDSVEESLAFDRCADISPRTQKIMADIALRYGLN